MARTILIGDLHGCYDEAVALMEKCQVRAEDQVVFVGDLVDRGPDSAKCVELAMRREQVQGSRAALLGNHEERHLEYEDILARTGKVPGQMPPTHVATRMQLGKEHYDYMRQLPLYLRFPEHNAVAVHAGVFPGRTIEQQKPRHLLHVQMIRPYDFNAQGHQVINEKSLWASRVPPNEEGWRFWHHFWDGPERIIFGHSVLDRPLVTPQAVGIDGGGCFGLELWACILPGWEIVRVKARAAHGNRDRKPIKIDGEVGTY